MSCVPYVTQLDRNSCSTQGSQVTSTIFMIYPDQVPEHQATLMSDCQNAISGLLTQIVHTLELDTIPPEARYFVVPTPEEDLLRVLRTKFKKSMIYTPRAVLEALNIHHVKLPARRLALSLSMLNCRIFLVRSCNVDDLKHKINEMCGTIMPDFNDPNINVVITDRVDNKYCIRAQRRNIPVVSRDWVDENHRNAKFEEQFVFNNDALATISQHIVKPFFGLHFKIDIPVSLLRPGNTNIMHLIPEYQGSIVYGEESGITHIISHQSRNSESFSSDDSTHKEPRIVDIDFVRVCVEQGRYLPRKEYSDYRQKCTVSSPISSNVIIKQEPVMPPPTISRVQSQIRHLTPATGGLYREPPHQSPSRFIAATRNLPVRSLENHTSVLPPPQAPRATRQPNITNDMILKALSSLENGAQTQYASTQMRRLPEREISIEQTYEPSQQLYWNDSATRRN